ncbi:MAG: ATP-grasp domain-containing protein [Candidatus Peregrinibacteria bacterium]|nr:ATP-grasp domain-containing protein [Candidatus Peregrinibacteria bacterium]MDZ4245439.1 ATP-grasp domain-containing protein [Candidatus Gracilibacteria bacterium]
MTTEKIKNLLNERLNNHLIVFVAKDFSRGVGLEKFLPNFAIVCGTDSEAIDIAKSSGINIFCLNEDSEPGSENAGKILESIVSQGYIKDLQKQLSCSKVSILTFKGSSKIEFVCKKNNWGYLNLDAKTTTYLEEKANFEKLLKDYDGALLQTLSGKLKDINPEILLDQSLEKKLAIQFTHGFAGQSTHFVNYDGFQKLQNEFPEKKVKVTPYITGETLTLNGCIYNDEVYISYPFLQKTGDPEFSRHEGGTCGVIFDKERVLKKVPEEMLEKTIKASYALAENFKKHGLRGFFGFDLVTDGKEVCPIELNPRLTANIHPFTIQQIAKDLSPFLLLHILEFLNIKTETPAKEQYLTPLRGETTSLRNVTDTPFTLNEAKSTTSHTFEHLLTNPEIIEMFILLKNGQSITPDGRWGEKWSL